MKKEKIKNPPVFSTLFRLCLPFRSWFCRGWGSLLSLSLSVSLSLSLALSLAPPPPPPPPPPFQVSNMGDQGEQSEEEMLATYPLSEGLTSAEAAERLKKYGPNQGNSELQEGFFPIIVYFFLFKLMVHLECSC